MITVRRLRQDEARTFLAIHRGSVHGLVGAHYSPEVLDAWSAPVTDDRIARFLINPNGDIRLIAEADGVPVGIGALAVAASELLACYVVPEAARQGVGTALVREVERIAVEYGGTQLTLLSSLNAEPFYAALGYEVHERTEHQLRGGVRMPAVRMARRLA